MLTAKYISTYFLKKGVTPLKLQKLLFYAQVWYFKKNNTKLFDDEIQAWVLGPVVKTIYDEYKHFRRGDFINPERFKDAPPLVGSLTSFLNEVWEVYGGFTGLELVDLTHEDPIWRNAREGLEDYMNSQRVMEINEETTAHLRLQDNSIPKINKQVAGLGWFSGNAGEELF